MNARASNAIHPIQIAAHVGGDWLSKQSTSARIPSLDGLRAIGITLVLIGHSLLAHAGGWTARERVYFEITATTGVRVFFVLSGFLITSILLRQLNEKGTLSLRDFYFRRTLRIFPAFYCFLITVALLFAFDVLQTGRPHLSDFIKAICYVSNYGPELASSIAHTWSLSVEEQFYLLWPLALILSGRKFALIPLLSAVVAAPLFRLVSVESGAFYGTGQRAFECVADSLATGCLAAVLQKQLISIRWGKSAASLLLALCAVLLPAVNAHSRFARTAVVIGIPLMNLTIALAIIAAIAQPPRWLNLAPVSMLGRISYSLYLWQQPLFQEPRLGFFWIPVALLCAYASYRFIEQPILRWRDSRCGGRFSLGSAGKVHQPGPAAVGLDSGRHTPADRRPSVLPPDGKNVCGRGVRRTQDTSHD